MIPFQVEALVRTCTGFSHEIHPDQTRIFVFSAVNPANVEIVFPDFYMTKPMRKATQSRTAYNSLYDSRNTGATRDSFKYSPAAYNRTSTNKEDKVIPIWVLKL